MTDNENLNENVNENDNTNNIPEENTQDTQDTTYSYKKEEIPESRVSIDSESGYRDFYKNTTSTQESEPSEYEVSFDSQSGTYSYSGEFSNTQANGKPPKKHRSGIGLMIVTLCLSLVISGTVGGIVGYFAGNNLSSSSNSQPADVGAIVDKYTTVIVNTAENQENAITSAVKVAYNTSVTVDTFYSEEYEILNEPWGSGSGVIWTADGYIVTCNHVIEDASIIRVTLTDGTSYPATVVGTDSRTDLAVLKIEPDDGVTLYPVAVRGTDIILGETAIAIGNPLGVLGGTVSTGIISALERQITIEGQSMTLLQTDAAVNSGNSGGGLFDINGSLIGIVNAKSIGDSVEGLGFAIPITTVHEIANELITNGYVTGRPQLGISVVSVTDSNYATIFSSEYYPELKDYATKKYSDNWGFQRTTVVTGIYIVDCSLVAGYEGSERLKYGDKVLYVGDTEVTELSDIKYALNSVSAGDTITVTVLRDQTTTVIVNIVLGQAGANQ